MRRIKSDIVLDRRITIQEYSEDQNSFGEKEVSFSELGTVWAKVEYRTASEKFHANRETAITNVFFTIRYNINYLNKKNRIVFENQTYDIESVKEVTRRRFLEIEAILRE